MSAALTGGVLLKCAVRAQASPGLRQSLVKLAGDCVPLAESLAAHAALELEETYLYLFSRESAAVNAAVLSRLLDKAAGLAELKGAALAAAKLIPVFDRPGASRTREAAFHYVVETDVDPAHEADLNAWY